MSGLTFQLVSNVMRALVNRRSLCLTTSWEIPSPLLFPAQGHHVCLQASNFVKFENVQSVNFARYVAQWKACVLLI